MKLFLKTKQEIKNVIPTLRKIAAYADCNPDLGEEWARKFSRMISDIEDCMLAEQADDGGVIIGG